MHFSLVNEYCIASGIVIFNIVGLFGNFQIMWMIFRRKSTQSKAGVLLGTNALNHTICLLSEIVNAIFILSDKLFTRRQCYPYMAVYMFFICQQASMTLMISMDMLAALFFPVWYRSCRTLPYVSTVISICSIYSFSVAFWGWTAVNNDIIPFCNPPLALAPHVSRFWSATNFAINALVVLLYTLSMLLVAVSAKSSSRLRQLKAIRRLQVVVFVFILSWSMASLGSDIGAWILSPNVLPIWESNLVFFALICYSQTFYVCMWRSSEYRQAFKEQVQIMTCKNSKRQSVESIHITGNT